MTLLFALIIGTIPAAVVGLLFKDDIESYLHHPHIVVYPLALVGILLWLIDALAPKKRDVSTLTIKDGLLVGIAQVFALIPGTSRSGATMVGHEF